MAQRRAQYLFLLGLGLMLSYRMLVKLPFLPDQLLGFDTPKLLKILIGMLFISLTLAHYRKSFKN
ncbi:hypothetical protein A3SI_02958 [Nitritalea halalkaliphila LW7]|uniref:Uncharacterized protein n=1 Tax=Nitritalea halalkaliphila LW7 TaxID=1189621 RepID=I5C9I0_9BACT|nr:hypothetical protein [Nitritalea halalkaliphila]EIM78482.1 hypothetical protein A3SI_02958 [Nitritalea halalkaliphila LW7]